MRVLALVAQQRMPNNDVMYSAFQGSIDIELVKLSSEEQKKLRKFLKNFELGKYDRIVLDLHFKRIIKQARFIRTLPHLVIYEEDACQNYIEESKWYGKFLQFYKKLGNFRLICTSKQLSDQFKSEGLDAQFLAKAYDQDVLKDLQIERDIELGFIGRTASATYSQRSVFLSSVEKTDGLKLIRTAPGAEYLRMLNRIKIFVSADIGLGEYMIKNFEAMACGCLVFAFRQGGGEEEALGLRDMENIVLYKDVNEFQEKLHYIRSQPLQEKKIIENSLRLVEENFSYNALAEGFIAILKQKTIVVGQTTSWYQRIWS